MVWEERFFAGPEDIISIRLTCKECQSTMTIKFGERQYVPESCAYCEKVWLQKGSNDHKLVEWLLKSLSGLKERTKDAACAIHLELPGTLNMPSGK